MNIIKKERIKFILLLAVIVLPLFVLASQLIQVSFFSNTQPLSVQNKKEEPKFIQIEVFETTVGASTKIVRFKFDGVEYVIWSVFQNDILLSKKMISEDEKKMPEASNIH
jgi:hypothetical protein